MKKITALITAVVLAAAPLYAADGGYSPPSESEPAVLDSAAGDFPPELILSAAAVLAAGGCGLSAAGAYSVFDGIDDGFESPGLQSGIIMFFAGALTAAAGGMIFDWFFNGECGNPAVNTADGSDAGSAADEASGSAADEASGIPATSEE